MFTLYMNMTSKGESPRERQARAKPTPTPTLKTFEICKRSHAIFNISSIFAMLQDGIGKWPLSPLYIPPPPTAYRITTDTSPDASTITCPTCP
jgi:hypothetical protein